MAGKVEVKSTVIFNGKKYSGTCVICVHSYPHIYENEMVCTKDLDKRRIKLENGKPNWCPLVEFSELDYIKSC